MTSQAFAAIYTRITEDPASRAKKGQGVNVATQEADGRRRAAELGLQVLDHHVFTDNDTTAADATVTRPGFEALLQGALAGDFGTVIVHDQSRLVRQPADMERVIGTFTVAQVALVPLVGTSDLTSPEGKLYARFNTLLGSYEVEKVRARVLRKMRDNAEKGEPCSGTPAYGFAADKINHDPAEAARVREAVDRVNDGESLNAIATSWNAQGVATKKGGAKWRGDSVRRIIMNPAVAGLRVHQGKVLEGVVPVWSPIVDLEAWQLAVKKLTNPSRRTAASTRQCLLTRLIECGACGSTMNHKIDKSPKYYCRHCHGRMVDALQLEAFLVGQMAGYLDSPEVAEAMDRQREATGTDVLMGEIESIEADKLGLAADHGAGVISREEWKAALGPLNARLNALRAELGRTQADTVLSVWAGQGVALESRWEALTVPEQRRLVATCFESVVIGPGKRTSRFDPDRVAVTFAA